MFKDIFKFYPAEKEKFTQEGLKNVYKRRFVVGIKVFFGFRIKAKDFYIFDTDLKADAK